MPYSRIASKFDWWRLTRIERAAIPARCFREQNPRHMMTESMEIPPELFARLAHPTVRLSGSIDEGTAASFLSQVLPVLEVPGSIVVELFSSGGAVEVDDDWPKKSAYCVRLMGVTCGSSARRSSRRQR